MCRNKVEVQAQQQGNAAGEDNQNTGDEAGEDKQNTGDEAGEDKQNTDNEAGADSQNADNAAQDEDLQQAASEVEGNCRRGAASQAVRSCKEASGNSRGYRAEA